MGGRRRTRLAVEAERRNLEQLSRLGADVRRARRARSLTQVSLGDRAGVGRMTVSRLERGRGGGVSLDAWQRIALAVGRPLTVGLQRAVDGETRDAGHLAIQELVLRLGRAAGYRGLVELPTTPLEPWRSIDVALADDSRRRLLVVECWNTIGDVGPGARASMRKAAEVEQLAAARWAWAIIVSGSCGSFAQALATARSLLTTRRSSRRGSRGRPIGGLGRLRMASPRRSKRASSGRPSMAAGSFPCGGDGAVNDRARRASGGQPVWNRRTTSSARAIPPTPIASSSRRASGAQNRATGSTSTATTA